VQSWNLLPDVEGAEDCFALRDFVPAVVCSVDAWGPKAQFADQRASAACRTRGSRTAEELARFGAIPSGPFQSRMTNGEPLR
jgi:hypothetical protein